MNMKSLLAALGAHPVAAACLLTFSLGWAAPAAWGADAGTSAPASTAPHASAPAARRVAPAKPAKAVKLVDINSASKADLMKIAGVGEAEAGKIVAGRPYLSKADLATRKILPTGVYLQIRRAIVAKPAAAAPAAAKKQP
jgi:DNA uptake protein ComE-like DNA-binding protein